MSDIFLAHSIKEAECNFPGNSPELVVCRYIFRRLSELGPQAEQFDLGSVASALGWRSSEQARAIVSALDFLAFCTKPVLSRHFALWGEYAGEILEQPIAELSDADVREALEKNELINPLTGELISDFTERITVGYKLEPYFAMISPKGVHSF